MSLNATSLCRSLVLLPALASGILWVGCSKSDSDKESDNGKPTTTPLTATGNSGKTATNPTDPHAAGRKISVIEIIETNTDTMPEQIISIEPTAAHTAPPFMIENGLVTFRPESAPRIDPDQPPARLILKPENLKPDSCGLLVIYTTRYLGKGRYLEQHDYYGYEKLPAELTIPSGFTGQQVSYDLEQSNEGFAMMLLKVRISDADQTISLTGTVEKPHVTIAGKPVELIKDKAVEVSTQNRKVDVSEAAQMSRPIGNRNAQPEVALPARKYGAISFTTTLNVKYLGQFGAGKAEETTEIIP